MSNKIDVTVLIASYNSDLEKLKKTIMSIIKQKKICVEIIVADDGSINNYFDELEKLFVKVNFLQYHLVAMDQNKGTCKNIYNGLLHASGKYLKTIAPGDYLFDDTVLFRWITEMDKYDMKISFGDAICYSNNGKCNEIVCVERRPQNIEIYKPNNYSSKKAILNYIFLNDAVFGINFMTETQFFVKYLRKVKNIIKYAEDMIYRMMIVDGERMMYFPANVIWYEYGNGISTNQNDKWREIIASERIIINKYMKYYNNFNGVKKIRFCLGLNCISRRNYSWIKYLVYPELIIWKLKKNRIKVFTSSEADISYIQSL